MKWELFKSSDDEWSKKQNGNPNSSYYNDVSHSKVLEKQGWKCLRYKSLAKIENEKYFIQVFFKKFFFLFTIYWIPNCNINEYNLIHNLKAIIIENKKTKFFYLRLRSHHKSNKIYIQNFSNNNLNRPKKYFGSGKTIIIDLTKTKEEILLKMSKNWLRNLKRSTKYNNSIIKISDPKIIINLYRELYKFKKITNRLSENEISNIMKYNKNNLIVFGIKNQFEEIISIRGVIQYNKTAIDIFAANNYQAKKSYASYKLLFYIIEHLKEKKIINYDLNGIDPINNLGVYNFKKGSGGYEQTNIGEFEFSNTKLLTFIINYIRR